MMTVAVKPELGFEDSFLSLQSLSFVLVCLGVLFLDVKARSYSPIPPWVLIGVYPPFFIATLFPEKSSKEKNTRQEQSDEWAEPNCVQ